MCDRKVTVHEREGEQGILVAVGAILVMLGAAASVPPPPTMPLSGYLVAAALVLAGSGIIGLGIASE